MEVISEESAVGDSQGNGLAEHAVRECKAKTRTLKLQTEELLGVAIGSSSSCLPWLVRHAAALINRGRRGPDGRTAWELRHGRRYRKELALFGEKVLYLPANKRESRLEERFEPGVFFGVTEGSEEASRLRRFRRASHCTGTSVGECKEKSM